MSQEERTGRRSLIYSQWHRRKNIRRFLANPVDAWKLTMIDIDSCEVCCYCKKPVALIETQESIREPKAAPFMANLAEQADLPAFSVSYEPHADGKDIVMFQVRQIQPYDSEIHHMKPDVYAYWLLSLREQHDRRAHT